MGIAKGFKGLQIWVCRAGVKGTRVCRGVGGKLGFGSLGQAELGFAKGSRETRACRSGFARGSRGIRVWKSKFTRGLRELGFANGAMGVRSCKER